MAREFKGLLKSEIQKIESAANKISGFKNCKVTGYGASITHPFDFDPEVTFVEVDAEICRDYEERVDCVVHMSIPMFDRRKSWITKAEMI